MKGGTVASWNQWTGIGNCTRDLELRTLPSGSSVAAGGIACNRKYKTAQGEEREEVLFLDFECFGKAGEILAQYAGKGKQLFLSGRLVADQWEDKTGNKRTKIKLVVDNFQFLGAPSAGDDGDQRQESKFNRPPQSKAFGAASRVPQVDIPF